MRKRLPSIIALILMTVIVVAAFTIEKDTVGHDAASLDFEMVLNTDKDLTLEALKGTIVVLEFWSMY